MSILNQINGKRILFISPKFFSYETSIHQKMCEYGAIVDYFDSRSVTKSFHKALLKIHPNIFYFKTKKYFNDILKKTSSNQYDYVLIIKCDMFTTAMLKKLRNTFKEAVFSLYLWDSIKNIPGIKKKISFFDKIYSFDRIDCLNNSEIKFRPLFYKDEFKSDVLNKHIDYKYSLSFLGTLHSDRYKIIRKIREFCNINSFSFFTFMYFRSKLFYYLLKMVKSEFRNSKIEEFNFETMKSKDIAEVIKNSKVVLDIQHPNQTGLTMRTIEMIGMGKKLITTNHDILNYNFYNSSNILLINRKDLEIENSFFQSEYVPIDLAIYNSYSLEYWLKEIL